MRSTTVLSSLTIKNTIGQIKSRNKMRDTHKQSFSLQMMTRARRKKYRVTSFYYSRYRDNHLRDHIALPLKRVKDAAKQHTQ